MTYIGIFNVEGNLYRSPGFFNEMVSVKLNNSVININKEGANYINTIRNLAHANKWKKNNYLIDLTGASPGTLLILGANFITTPWLLGGYDGSFEYTKKSLENGLKFLNSADLSKTWILTSPDGNRKIDSSILPTVGINFPINYQSLGQIIFNYDRNETHILWKPISV